MKFFFETTRPPECWIKIHREEQGDAEEYLYHIYPDKFPDAPMEINAWKRITEKELPRSIVWEVIGHDVWQGHVP
jgi:hypothetical protein